MGFAAKRRIGAIVAKTNALPVPLPVPADNYPCSSANAPCSDLKGIVAPARPLIHARDAWRQDFDMIAAGTLPYPAQTLAWRGAQPARFRRPTRSPPPGRRRARGHRGRSHPCRACGCSLRSLADLQRLVGAADTVGGCLDGPGRRRAHAQQHGGAFPLRSPPGEPLSGGNCRAHPAQPSRRHSTSETSFPSRRGSPAFRPAPASTFSWCEPARRPLGKIGRPPGRRTFSARLR